MQEQTKEQTHTPQGRFKKGNNLGIKHGSYTRQRLLRTLTDEQLDQLVQDEYTKAIDGDPVARQFLLGRWIAPLKPTHGATQFKLDFENGVEGCVQDVLTAVSQGVLNAEQGQQFIGMLKDGIGIGTMQQMTHKLAELEARLNERDALPRDITPALSGGTSRPSDTIPPVPQTWQEGVAEND